MSRRDLAIRQFVAVSLALFAVLFVVGHCSACASATPQEKAAAAEATYAAELIACVEKSATMEESLVCRRGVRERWKVDGGSR